jgi:mRNA-degrading endonuclease toxin of MazEF toxin-antitoxin module
MVPKTLDDSNTVREVQITGTDFSPEVAVVLQPDLTNSRLKNVSAVPVPVTAQDPTGFTAKVPVGLEVGDWVVQITNGPDESPVNAGSLHITDKVGSAKKNLRRDGWIGVGTGIAATGVALVTGILGYTAYEKYENATTPDDASTYRSTSSTMSSICVPTGIGGVVLLATGIVLMRLGASR